MRFGVGLQYCVEHVDGFSMGHVSNTLAMLLVEHSKCTQTQRMDTHPNGLCTLCQQNASITNYATAAQLCSRQRTQIHVLDYNHMLHPVLQSRK